MTTNKAKAAAKKKTTRPARSRDGELQREIEAIKLIGDFFQPITVGGACEALETIFSSLRGSEDARVDDALAKLVAGLAVESNRKQMDVCMAALRFIYAHRNEAKCDEYIRRVQQRRDEKVKK